MSPSLARPGVSVRALWAPRGDRPLVAYGDGTAALYDRASGDALWRGDAIDARLLAVTGDGTAFVYVDRSLTKVTAVRVDDGGLDPHATVGAAPTLTRIACAIEGRGVVWSSYAPPYDYGEVARWELGSPTPSDVDTETGRTTLVGFSSDSEHVVIGYGSTVAIHSLTDPSAKAQRHSIDLYANHVSPVRGTSEVLLSNDYGDVVLLDLETGEKRWRIARESAPLEKTTSRTLLHSDGAHVAWLPAFPERADGGPVWVRRMGEPHDVTLPRPPSDMWREGVWLRASGHLAVRTHTQIFVYDVLGPAPRVCSVWTSSAGALTAMASSPDDQLIVGTASGALCFP